MGFLLEDGDGDDGIIVRDPGTLSKVLLETPGGWRTRPAILPLLCSASSDIQDPRISLKFGHFSDFGKRGQR
jgi:hypothetical protein